MKASANPRTDEAGATKSYVYVYMYVCICSFQVSVCRLTENSHQANICRACDAKVECELLASHELALDATSEHANPLMGFFYRSGQGNHKDPRKALSRGMPNVLHGLRFLSKSQQAPLDHSSHRVAPWRAAH